MSNSGIENAFKALLATFATSNSLTVSWPGVPFTPPESGSWLEMAFFPNETINLALGNDGSQYRGFLQVSCCCRAHGGDGIAVTLADSVIAAFPKGTALGIAKVERKPWASTVLIAPDRISVPVTVPYQGAVSA